MAITSNRYINISFTGDTSSTNNRSAAANTSSPGQTDLLTFTGAGNTTITPPTGGSTPTAVTITPPAGNLQTMTLKGIGADVGIVLHKTDPTSIALNSPTNTFVITTSGTITGVRFDWS
jgi:hypothetical protein